MDFVGTRKAETSSQFRTHPERSMCPPSVCRATDQESDKQLKELADEPFSWALKTV